MTITDVLQTLIAGEELPPALLRAVVEELIHGRFGDAETAAFLIALRMKGETSHEIATATQVLRDHMIRWEPNRDDVLDTCGTGGDGSGTFNISTATALVIAGAGVPVVKHGNRAVSSRSGSADVLAALGVRIDGDVPHVQRCLKEASFAFCFAPIFHPALKHIAAVRRTLGVPTIFNCLGPLANPAGARRQLLGVGRYELLDLLASALAELGTTRALLVCSQDGLDEVSLSAPTDVRWVEDGQVRSLIWLPEDFELPRCALGDLAALDAIASAARIEEVLDGGDSPAVSIVVANAAAGLIAAGRADLLRDGVALARESLRSGKAREVLTRLRAMKSEGSAAG